jgi:Na+-driven multidrug efflux pump
LFAIFIPEAEAIALGVVYLRILSVSQFWMAVEILTAGAFIGQGRTAPPAIISITFNALRIPGALLLSATSLGLKGVWWAVSITSIFKGLILAGWYLRSLYTNPALSDFRRGLARSESN